MQKTKPPSAKSLSPVCLQQCLSSIASQKQRRQRVRSHVSFRIVKRTLTTLIAFRNIWNFISKTELSSVRYLVVIKLLKRSSIYPTICLITLKRNPQRFSAIIAAAESYSRINSLCNSMLPFTPDSTDTDATTKNVRRPILQETIQKFISESMQESNHSNARYATSISSQSPTK